MTDLPLKFSVGIGDAEHSIGAVEQVNPWRNERP
jgi:hypothetical protein